MLSSFEFLQRDARVRRLDDASGFTLEVGEGFRVGLLENIVMVPGPAQGDPA